MKATMLLLRWYKSFNINYRQDAPARKSEQPRPWNHLDVTERYQDQYPFIEIPLEGDITTIVGGNESGKSHLLSSISKVLTGKGIDGAPFAQTDLCRYATIPELVENSDRWATIGISFRTTSNGEDLELALRDANITDIEKPQTITLIIGAPKGDVAAHVFIDGAASPRAIKSGGLESMRKRLPRIEFIDARAALPDNLTLTELSKAMQKALPIPAMRYPHAVAQEAAAMLQQMPATPSQPLSLEWTKQISSLQAKLNARREGVVEDAMLAVHLLCDVLSIEPGAILRVLELPLDQRGFIDYHVNGWNQRIADRLNLRRFWRQDDHAALVMRYRDGTLYFDITDKTGATYTFRERSSGLRYFLSYYIQAKAMEASSRNQNAIILMDEPDSFLSILGQKNLLAVFESLVSYESSKQTCQLVYTTHSPFLLNQNFPRRVRVVTKEEAEEGTQYQGHASSRRYEPVRSALGISCAQTLFMGATNLVLEGPTDQYLLTEVIRLNATPENVSEWLDLNTIVIVPADGVDNVERLLIASRWGEEPVPATVVLIDSDRRDVIERITGQTRGSAQLVDREFAKTIDDLMAPGTSGKFMTIEDLVPWSLYSSAIKAYVKRWKAVVHNEHGSKLAESLMAHSDEPNLRRAVSAISSATGGLLSLDKLGVLAEVIDISRVRTEDATDRGGANELFRRVKHLCAQLSKLIEASRQRSSHQSTAQTIKRLIREFLMSRDLGACVTDLDSLLARVDRELATTGSDSATSRYPITKLQSDLNSLLQVGQTRLAGEDWQKWRIRLENIRRHPFECNAPDDISSDSQKKPRQPAVATADAEDNGKSPNAKVAAGAP